MFVLPQARRAGLATALLARLTEDPGTDVDEIRLTVAVGNAEAVRLYAKAGFRVYGAERRVLNGRPRDELLMSLKLRPAD
jgi:ribosomal protein S18 acetylase RimI-like enzyme